jgi:bifunctional DNA-binding transcriptional regulator/antitoxin component of YhaV-PrlF toxin-antitoxin module
VTHSMHVVSMDARRRVVLPRGLVRAAGLEVGEDLLASTDGDGSIVLRARTANMRLLRDELDEAFGPAGVRPVDVDADLCVDRHLSDAVLDRRITSSSEDFRGVGAALLDRLGL